MRQEVVHHPSGEFLIDYASGSASEAVSLLVATHLALCPVCRQGVAALETIGSQALEPAGADPTSLPALPAHTHPRAVEAQLRTVGSETLFPEPLRGYLGGEAANFIWSRPLIGPAEFALPAHYPVLDDYIAERTEAGGALPVS